MKTWVKVVIAIALLSMLLVVALVGGGIYVVSRHVQVAEQLDEATVAEEFAHVRARFLGQAPLLAIDGDRLTTDELERRMATYTGPTPQTLRLLVWSGSDHKLVRLAVPFWLLRLTQDQPMKLDVEGMEQVRVSPAELDRAGPALLLDHHDEKARVLVWTE